MIDRKKVLRILIVDDSPIVCKVLSTIINDDKQLIVAGIAHNGQEAIEIVPKLKPDLITMDINMPVMDGMQATKHIMAYWPTPILVITTTILKGSADLAFEAMAYGALDVMDKSFFKDIGISDESQQDLTDHIKRLCQISVIRHPLARIEHHGTAKAVSVPKRIAGERIIAIAASTGGPHALLTILKAFPKDFPCGVVIVQHISAGFTKGLVEWLNGECQIHVTTGRPGMRIRPGKAYVAPAAVHMKVSKKGLIQLADEETCGGHCPSANVLFTSVAEHYKERAIAVILSGMGEDGVEGLKRIKETGGRVLAQNEATSVVFGMPKAAIEGDAVHTVLPIGQIAKWIIDELMQSKTSSFNNKKQA